MMIFFKRKKKREYTGEEVKTHGNRGNFHWTRGGKNIILDKSVGINIIFFWMINNIYINLVL